MSKWVKREAADISWEHCGRPAYWCGESVYCSKCQSALDEQRVVIGDWFGVIVKFKTLDEATALAHKLDAEGYQDITIDSSEWQDDEIELEEE